MTIVSQIITDAKKKQKSFKERMKSLNLLMQNRQIDNHLQMKVRKYIEYLQESDENITNASKDIAFLPTSIKQDVQIDMYGNLIKKQKLFYLNFSKQSLEKLALAVHEISAGPGEVIFKPNDNPDSLYIVLSGRIEIFIHNQKFNGVESETHISYIEKGCVFGAEDFFYQKSRQNSAKATQLSQIIQIDRNQLESVLKQNLDDYEKFKMLNDMVKYSNTTRGLGIQCHFCKNYTHSFSECPNVTYAKKKDQIIHRLNISEDQKRDFYPRKHQKSQNSLFFQPFLVKSIKIFVDLRQYNSKDSENDDGMLSGASEDIVVEDDPLEQIITEYTQKLKNTQRTEEISEVMDDEEEEYIKKLQSDKNQDRNDQFSQQGTENSLQTPQQFQFNNNNNSGDEKDNKRGNSKILQNRFSEEVISSSPNILSQKQNSLTIIQHNSPTFNQQTFTNFNDNNQQEPNLQQFQLASQVQQISPPQSSQEKDKYSSSVQKMFSAEIKLFPSFTNTQNETRVNRQTSLDFQSQNLNLQPQRQVTNNFNEIKNTKQTSSYFYNQSSQNMYTTPINQNVQNYTLQVSQQQPLSPQLINEVYRQRQSQQEISLMKLNTMNSNINTVGGKFDSKPTQNVGSQLTAFEHLRGGSSSNNQISFHSKNFRDIDTKGAQSLMTKDMTTSNNNNINSNINSISNNQEIKHLNSNQQQNQNHNQFENSIEINSIRAIKALNNWESETLKRFDRYKIFAKYFPQQNINKVLEYYNYNMKNSKRNSLTKRKNKRQTVFKKFDAILRSQYQNVEISPRKGISNKTIIITPQNSEYMNKLLNINPSSKFDTQKEE